MTTDNSPVALIEVQSMEDISILINTDPTMEDIDSEVDDYMQILSLCGKDSFDDILELWGFWVDDINRDSLIQEIRESRFQESVQSQENVVYQIGNRVNGDFAGRDIVKN